MEQTAKPETIWPLNPLSILSKPWELIGINFIGPLPLLKNRDGEFDSITVVIDLLTVMVHLFPNQITYTAPEIVELVFVKVYKYHRLPKSIVSDQDALFTSTFWTHLQKLLGIDQRMSSAFQLPVGWLYQKSELNCWADAMLMHWTQLA